MNKNILHSALKIIFIFSAERVMGRNIIRASECHYKWCALSVPPELFFFFLKWSTTFSEFLCVRINLAPRAVETRLVGWSGSDCCDALTGCCHFCKGSVQGKAQRGTDSANGKLWWIVGLWMCRKSQAGPFSESPICFFKCYLFFLHLKLYNLTTVLYQEFKTGLIKSV